jgi:hypothetical protein
VARDRDEAGRPRNARPRDETGRPLPRDAAGVPPDEEQALATPAVVLAAAQRALDDGRPFAAHEYLEEAWHRADAAERDLWQGLAQVAVGLTHLQRSNNSGALALLERSRERLSSYAGSTPHGIDVDGVRMATERLAEALRANKPITESVRLRIAQ